MCVCVCVFVCVCVGSFSFAKGHQANIESINQYRITQKEHLLIWNSETTQKPKHLSSQLPNINSYLSSYKA